MPYRETQLDSRPGWLVDRLSAGVREVRVRTSFDRVAVAVGTGGGRADTAGLCAALAALAALSLDAHK